ncbi:MAG: ComEC/Rec2 family competence protein, partial [Polyangiales bacterium]
MSGCGQTPAAAAIGLPVLPGFAGRGDGTPLAAAHHVLGWIAFAWVLGVAAGTWGVAGGETVLAIAALMGALPLALARDALFARLWALPLAALSCCAGLGMARPSLPACSDRGRITATATVDRLRFGAEEVDVWLQVVAGRWRESGAHVGSAMRIRLRTPIGDAPPLASLVEFQGAVRPPTILRNRSLKPWRTRRPDGACWATGSIEVDSPTSMESIVSSARDRVRQRLIDGLPGDTASVARALILGDGAALPYERRRTIAAVGLAHLFAVSGLHIALISGTLVRLIAWMLQGVCIGVAPVRVAAAIGVPLTLLHATFAGGAPSAWRAAVT